MRPIETTAALTGFENRGPGTDAERRAARWLAGELVANRHRVRIETFWCRPDWALALVSTLADGTFGISLGRRLTHERASQNVIASPASTHNDEPRTRLIVTANYDAGRTGLIYRDALRKAAARVRRATGDLAPGWLAWLAIAITYELAIAVVRMTTHHPSSAPGPLQLPPTVALVLALALLLEAAAADYGPAAGDNATGTAAAVALTRAIAADPPHNLTVELVLQGAGEDEQIGLRRYLRARKNALNRSSRQ